jgi:hypothetical protein
LLTAEIELTPIISDTDYLELTPVVLQFLTDRRNRTDTDFTDTDFTSGHDPVGSDHSRGPPIASRGVVSSTPRIAQEVLMTLLETRTTAQLNTQDLGSRRRAPGHPPLQLLAYHVARLKKCDIDKMRNLAKSVTVE